MQVFCYFLLARLSHYPDEGARLSAWTSGPPARLRQSGGSVLTRLGPLQERGGDERGEGAPSARKYASGECAGYAPVKEATTSLSEDAGNQIIYIATGAGHERIYFARGTGNQRTLVAKKKGPASPQEARKTKNICVSLGSALPFCLYLGMRGVCAADGRRLLVSPVVRKAPVMKGFSSQRAPAMKRFTL